MKLRRYIAAIMVLVGAGSQLTAQIMPSLTDKGYRRSEIYNYHALDPDNPDDMLLLLESADKIAEGDTVPVEVLPTVASAGALLQPYNFRPVVFDSFMFLDPVRLSAAGSGSAPSLSPMFDADALNAALIRDAKQSIFVNYPSMIIYNEADLPEPPKKYESRVDPETAKIVIAEVLPAEVTAANLEAKFERRHWLRTFIGDIQFSQAYVSPNWYQGGNNNLNILVNAYYNVKLNPAFHPKWLFETTVQYKLGLNNAPDDKLRDYNISEDIFQFNLLAGYKASKRWYYSTTMSFKTQFLNNYKPNTHDLRGAFLSPGELNVGVGMTYNYVNPKKTFTLDASIAPFSWNMKTCFNHRMDVTAYGIKPGRHVVSEYGSSGEVKIGWKICDNIDVRSRFFVFTNYDYAYGDWENTFSFGINRFLSTQIYVHMRYDTSTPACDNPSWHKFQLKEILSFGFSYKFATL